MGHEVADCGNKVGSQTLCCPGVQRPRLGMQTGSLGQRHPKGHDGLDQCSARAEYPSQWVHSALADGPIPAWVSQCSPCPIPLWGCGSRHLPPPYPPTPTIMGGEESRSNSTPSRSTEGHLDPLPPAPSGEPRLGDRGLVTLTILDDISGTPRLGLLPQAGSALLQPLQGQAGRWDPHRQDPPGQLPKGHASLTHAVAYTQLPLPHPCAGRDP